MLGTLYTMGYTGRTPEEIAQTAIGAKATVVDIRLSPRSRVYQWQGATLRSFLEARGVAYVHIPDLGNLNYRTSGKVDLKDPENGAEALFRLLNSGNCIILCVCKELAGCHRDDVAQLMNRDYGISVQHLTQRKDETHEPHPPQLDLL